MTFDYQCVNCGSWRDVKDGFCINCHQWHYKIRVKHFMVRSKGTHHLFFKLKECRKFVKEYGGSVTYLRRRSWWSKKTNMIITEQTYIHEGQYCS